MNNIKRGIVLFDLHYPDNDKASTNVAYKFTKDFRPDFFVLGGDQMDMNSISFFNKGKPKLTEGKRLKAEYDAFQGDILDVFEPVLKKSCDKIWIDGNHEYRVTRLIESDTQYEGFIEPENNLDLKQWDKIGYNGVLQIGHMYIIHGLYVNIHHSKKHLQVYANNIFYGHTHTNQIHTMTTPIDNQPKQAIGVGCLCNKNPSYMRGRPNGWIHQFMYFYLLPDGTFHYYLPVIIDGHCVINNKIY